MRRYIVLLLITGIVWAQTDFDTLVLKDGTTYLGEYSKIEGEIVYFKPQNAFAFQPISINKIKILQLKDGQFIILDGKDILAYEEYQKNSLEEYQKLSTKEKGIYDANLYNLNKWALYGPTSIIVFTGSIFLHKGLIGGESWESPIFLGGSPAASLTIPYFVLNSKEKFNFPKSILTDSEKEIYKQAYSKKLKQRKIKYAVGSICISVGGFILLTLISISNGLKNSSSSGNWGPVANP
jgi:hypothetical protein